MLPQIVKRGISSNAKPVQKGEAFAHAHMQSGQSLCTAELQPCNLDKQLQTKSPINDYRGPDTMDKKAGMSSGVKTSKLSGRYV